MIPKRSWLGVFFAVYIHLWRAHRKLANAQQELSYENLTEPLLDGQLQALDFVDRNGHPRRISAVSTPPGWSGKSVVLIHDLKMRLETWSPVWELLREDGHQIIAADLPGHGGSNLTEGSLELSSLAADIWHIMDHFGVSEGVLVGHGVGGFLALQYLVEYRKDATRRLPFGFVCVACTAGNLQQVIGRENSLFGRETLRHMATGFAALRLPELFAYFEFSGEASVSKRLGSKASYAEVRVVLEAKRRAHSDWALRNLSDMLWTLDLHPAISALTLPSSVLLCGSDDRNPQPLALRDAFVSSGTLHHFKMLEDASAYSLPLAQAEEVTQAVRSALA
ncbi:unnamed protein product [Durusdinium trenchii]|uniref:AB hydrolase-1 domain-containing protein n=1 Tax=Durusdinium trenchii TaxID=1381693 RepID=A0ABP0JKH9_9DINO